MKHKQRRNKDYSHFADNGIEFLDRVFDNIKRDYGYPITELCGEKEDA